MDLSVKGTSTLLKVSEKTIYRWIKQGSIPAYKIHGSYRFNRAELIDWATSRRMGVSAEVYADPGEDARPLPELKAALEAGGIFYRVEGRNRDQVLSELVTNLRLPEEVDRDYLLEVLIAREKLAPTAFGGGIALPHPRSPGLLNLFQPTLTLAFLENPVDFGALDNQPVEALFLTLAPTLRDHLHLLRQLALVLSKAKFRTLIKRQGSREEIFNLFEQIGLPMQNPDASHPARLQGDLRP